MSHHNLRPARDFQRSLGPEGAQAVKPEAETAAARMAMRVRHLPLILVFTALFSVPAPSTAQGVDSVTMESAAKVDYRFYDPDLGYGSEATINPMSVLLNRGFSNLFYTGIERRPHKMDWGAGLSTVFSAIFHPSEPVQRRGGWKRWFDDEFVPGVGSVWSWGWSANYVGHVLGGGITHRYMTEWFDHQGVPHAGLAAGTFLMATMIVNEVVEQRGSTLPNAGTFADMVFFEPLGMLLFSSGGVTRFFSEKLTTKDWSPQAAITFPDGRIVNNSQTIAYKIPLPKTDRFELLFMVGFGSQSGISYALPDDYAISAAIGFATKRRIVHPVTGEESIEPALAAGMYFDRHDSLIASLMYSRGAFSWLQANVYPGVLPGRLNKMGAWATINEGNQVSFGLSAYPTLGMGLGIDLGR